MCNPGWCRNVHQPSDRRRDRQPPPPHCVRRFWKGDGGIISEFATRICGSSDLYAWSSRQPHASVNFITCHDGFTLHDLVSYDRKHNEANGESNRDGSDDNRSWNCGIEGPTHDAAIEQLRCRQIKNFLALTLFATGTPMLLMGDEIRRTHVERAKHLLISTDLAMSQVAQASGFTSATRLGIVFHAEVGEPPTEFRRRSRAMGAPA